VVERAVILCESDQITLKDIPLFGDTGVADHLSDFIPRDNQELKRIKKEIRRKSVETVERNFVIQALEKYEWNISRAAKETGLQRTNFQNMMKKYGIRRPDAQKKSD
jgi:DNA-binding NtrC family response regulator